MSCYKTSSYRAQSWLVTLLCAESFRSYAEVVGEYRMAWPKLRKNKSPGRLGAAGNHGGAVPDGAQTYGPVPDRTAGGSTSGPSVSGPWVAGPWVSGSSVSERPV